MCLSCAFALYKNDGQAVQSPVGDRQPPDVAQSSIPIITLVAFITA